MKGYYMSKLCFRKRAHTTWLLLQKTWPPL